MKSLEYRINCISIITPVYNAESIILELVNQLVKVLNSNSEIKSYEILLVEDGSADKSWTVIEGICKSNSNVKGIKLSKNFGQHFAITAGLQSCIGDYAVVMDCDLQHDPMYLIDLINLSKDFDIVYTFLAKREHSLLKNITASLFTKFFNYLIDNPELNTNIQVVSFSIISRKVVKAFLSYNDYQRHYLMVLRWLGFNSTYLEIQHKNRYEGESSYTVNKLVNHALNGIVYQSDKLLRLNIQIGFFIAFIAFFIGLYLIFTYFYSGYQNGWTSLIISIFFSLGIILISLGIMGVYIGKMFEQVKNRPKFVIDKKLNFVN